MTLAINGELYLLLRVIGAWETGKLTIAKLHMYTRSDCAIDNIVSIRFKLAQLQVHILRLSSINTALQPKQQDQSSAKFDQDPAIPHYNPQAQNLSPMFSKIA